MAEETVNSQTVDKTATPASVEPEIESLLPNIPDLADLFAGTPTTQETGKAPEQPKDGATKKEPVTPETADKEQHLEDLIPAGLKPEEDKPPEEPKKEEKPTASTSELPKPLDALAKPDTESTSPQK